MSKTLKIIKEAVQLLLESDDFYDAKKLADEHKKKAEKSKGTREFHDHMRAYHATMKRAHENEIRMGMHDDNRLKRYTHIEKHQKEMTHHAEKEHLHDIFHKEYDSGK
jgi:hypothetical protein